MPGRSRVVKPHDGTFVCGCGKELKKDIRTECKTCGAHHRETEDGLMEQIVPPKDGMEAWNGGVYVGPPDS